MIDDSFEGAWDSVQKKLDILSINPLLQTATGRMKNPRLLEGAEGVPPGFLDQDGNFVIQPEKRLDPLTAKRAFDRDPARGFTEEQKTAMIAQGVDPSLLRPMNQNLAREGKVNAGDHPLMWTANSDALPLKGLPPQEWEDLTIRPSFGELRARPGQSEAFKLPGARGIAPTTLNSRGPYFGEREWPKVKGLEGLGWHPRSGSAGHLTWNRNSGALPPGAEGIMMEHTDPSSPLYGRGMFDAEGMRKPMVDDVTIDPSMRRQGLGSDLVDLHRYSLPTHGQNTPLLRNPAETISARPFWDKYFQSRWGQDATRVPSDVRDASYLGGIDSPRLPLKPGQELPHHRAGILDLPLMDPSTGETIQDYGMFPTWLKDTPMGGMNHNLRVFDDNKPRDLAPLPPENRFNMALTRPKDLLSDIGESDDLDASDRTNRWLARQLIQEQGGTGKGGSSFKSRRRRKVKPGKFTRLSEQYPHIVRDL
jgi:hypothetical protein